MGRATNIEWCHHTFNPWRGCEKVSPGCKNCYAETLSHRNPAVLGEWGPGVRAIASESYWNQPRRWNAEARDARERRRVFCLSLGDVWEKHVDLVVPRTRLFNLIFDCPYLDWLLLTKRPDMAWHALFARDRFDLFFDPKKINRESVFHIMWRQVWHGVSVEDQVRADERVPFLISVPARQRFISAEPLLGTVRLDAIQPGCCVTVFYGPLLNALAGRPEIAMRGDTVAKVNWVIVGGETGGGARPMHPLWAESLLVQCRQYRTPFFFKQWGEWLPFCGGGQQGPIQTVQAIPGSELTQMEMIRVGKAKTNRLFLAKEWNEMPIGDPESLRRFVPVAAGKQAVP